MSIKKLNEKQKNIVKTVASVGGAVIAAGLAYMIGFKTGGKFCAEIINDELNSDNKTFSINHQGYDVVRVSFDRVGLGTYGISTYKAKD